MVRAARSVLGPTGAVADVSFARVLVLQLAVIQCLVGGLVAIFCIFPLILGIIIPID